MDSCPVFAGSDPCLAPAGHDGDHWTYWGKASDKVRPVMTWCGTEPWSHDTGRVRPDVLEAGARASERWRPALDALADL